MKQQLFSLLLFSCFFCFFSYPLVKADAPINQKTILIDIGHGGVDPGTVVDSIYEKDINLKIGLALKEVFNSMGAKVFMTREGDYDLSTPHAMYRKKSDFDHRISYINQSKADYYVSIHLNYLSDSRYYGAQVFYSTVLEQNKDIASQIQEYLNSKLNTHREIKKISNSIYMYSKLDVPGVLVECGFLSNVEERKLLQDDAYIHKFAQSLAEAFLQLS